MDVIIDQLVFRIDNPFQDTKEGGWIVGMVRCET